jgi:hypothetical protein
MSPANVTVIPIEFRTKCTAAGCRNLGRLVLRYADRAGRPIRQIELCFKHAQELLDRNRAAGLKVFDNRD